MILQLHGSNWPGAPRGDETASTADLTEPLLLHASQENNEKRRGTHSEAASPLKICRASESRGRHRGNLIGIFATKIYGLS